MQEMNVKKTIAAISRDSDGATVVILNEPNSANPWANSRNRGLIAAAYQAGFQSYYQTDPPKPKTERKPDHRPPPKPLSERRRELRRRLAKR